MARRRTRPALLAALLVGTTLAVGCGGDVPGGDTAAASAQRSLSGLVRTPTPTIALEPVTDIDGQSFTFRAEPGHLQLLYFGYLSCPDVCPTTFADLQAALQELGPEAAAVDTALVTIDPARDTAENVRSYLDHFVDGGRGLIITEPDRLQAVADEFGATYAVETVDGVVEVSHSAFVYVLDEQGRLLVQWPFGTPAGDMAADLRQLAPAAGSRTDAALTAVGR
ncbi:MAG: SCO family protein [Acidimicrobiia bacterium]